MAEMMTLIVSVALTFYVLFNFTENRELKEKIQSGKEFKLNGYLYKCNQVRELTELEK